MRRELTWLSYLRILLGVAGLSGALVLACAQCAVAPQPQTAPETRAAILTREIAWMDSTTPLLHFKTPYAYGAWRLKVEACSGLAREGWPSFYLAPTSPIFIGGEARAGYYDEDSQSIVLAFSAASVESTIEHELLHWFLHARKVVLSRNATETERAAARERLHPTEYFETKCGYLLHG